MKTTIRIIPQYEHLRPLIEELAQKGPDPTASVIYEGRNRILTMQAPSGELLNIKDFHCPRFPNNYIYTHLRDSKAKRSLENAVKLIEMGFDSPDPIAYVECTEHGRLTRSYYICLHVEANDMRLWLENPLKAAAVPGAAQTLARLHAHGVFHKDFSPGNIMFQQQSDGSFRYYLIDLNRMAFGVKSRSRLLRNLAAIYIESPEETARFGQLYGEAAGLDPDFTGTEALRQLQARNNRKKRLKVLKQIFKFKR